MALYRPTPTCPHCGEPTHKAIYRDQSHLPPMLQIIGDTFEGWESLEHTCKGQEEWIKSIKGVIDGKK